MNLLPAAILAPLAASLTAWMLSGSPVPMAVSILVSIVAITVSAIIGEGGGRIRDLAISFSPALMAGIALFIEGHLYSTGQALAVRAELPGLFHLGIAFLWWVTADILVRHAPGRHSNSNRQCLTGIVGGLILLATAASTVRYDVGPWELYPVAALPAVAFISCALFPSMPFIKRFCVIVTPTTIAITTLVLISTDAGDRLRLWIFPDTRSAEETASSRPAAPSGSRSLIDGASRHLPREANIHFNRQIVVQAKAHSPALFHSWLQFPLYVRTSTLTLFESDDVISPIRSGRWLYDIDDGREDNTILLDNLAPVGASPYTLFISRDSVGHLPVLSNSTTLFAGAVYEFADDWYQLAPAEEITRIRYTALAPPRRQGADPLFDTEQLREQNAPGIYLNLPPSPLASKVIALTAGFAPDNPLKSIREFLRVKATYSLNFTTPADSSPVEDFLFGNHKGHCEHYAAATVMMLRSLGIPSRIAYGYAGGSADPGQQILAFRDSDFHAWAEILTPDENQWAIFDTTPNVPAAASRSAERAALPLMDETVYHDFSEFDPGNLTSRRNFSESIAEFVALLSRHFLLTTLIGLGLLGGLWSFLPKRGGSGQRAVAGGLGKSAPAPFVPEFLSELELGARSLGFYRKPGQTWQELVNRLAGQHALPDHLNAAIAYYYSVCYSGKDRDPAAEKEFLQKIRDWKGIPASD